MEGHRYDIQPLTDGQGMGVAAIKNHFNGTFRGDYLLVAGNDSLVKINLHTDES